MPEALYTAAALLLVVAAVAWMAERARLPVPILLVVVGIALAVTPGLPAIELDPDVVMLVLLPPLIYYAAFSMSWHAFCENLRPILLLAIGCVIWTTIAVALAGHWMMQLPLGVAFILGAVVSPPDVVAPLAVAQRLGMPRRITSVLEGEGLVNDATALILFNLALTAVLTGQFSVTRAIVNFTLVLVGEAIWGLLIGYVMLRVRHYAREPRIEIMLSTLTPFFAFWLPHALGGSGVLATVVAGMYTGAAGINLIRSNTRLQALFFWDITVTIITGLIFLLTGLQARTVAAGLDAATLWQLALYGLLISAVVIVVRFIWVFPATYLPRYLFRSVAAREPVPSWRFPFMVAFTGVRGVVSVAAALSVPVLIAPGAPFPARAQLLVLTFMVVVVTLVLQGLTMPFVVRKLGLVDVGAKERLERTRREAEARVETARAALERLEAACRQWKLPDDFLTLRRERLRQHIRQLEAAEADGDGSDLAVRAHRMEMQLMDAERARLNALVNEGRITDEIRRRIERDLDLDEERLRRNVRGAAPDEEPLPVRLPWR